MDTEFHVEIEVEDRNKEKEMWQDILQINVGWRIESANWIKDW